MTELALTAEDTRQEVRLPGGDAVSYHEAGDGEEILLMLHGSGPGVSAWSNFGANLPVLAQHFRTVMPDLPGFGASDTPVLDRVYSVLAAERLIAFLDALDIDKVHVLGNSMGGNIAAEMAHRYPARVARMVLMGPGGLSVNVFSPGKSEGARRLSDFLDAPSREAMIAWVDTMVFDMTSVTTELIDERYAKATVPGEVERAKAIFATFNNSAFTRDHTPLWARAEEILTPTLITWGRDDRMLPYEFAHFAFRKLPDAELHAFARCGHWAQVERKDDFERIVMEFLSRS